MALAVSCTTLIPGSTGLQMAAGISRSAGGGGLGTKVQGFNRCWKADQGQVPWRGAAVERIRSRAVQCRAAVHKVEMIHEGKSYVLEVPEDETILSVALDSDLEVPHDCKLGVCMTCPAKLEKGSVDQSEGMLSDDVVERGYALMCVSYPKSDCTIRTIPEEELLSLQLATANDA